MARGPTGRLGAFLDGDSLAVYIASGQFVQKLSGHQAGMSCIRRGA
jgi:hypothetical protein